MGIRDQEIARLVKYAEGMGLKVTFDDIGGDSAADWALDGTEINIYTKHQVSKTDTILSLIHEIAHHVWFIHEKNRLPDLKFEEAIDRQNLYHNQLSATPAPKKQREKILRCEVAGTKYWEIIWKETNIKLPKWKLFAAMEFDLYSYEKYAESGHFPNRPERREMLKTINEKHRSTNYE